MTRAEIIVDWSTDFRGILRVLGSTTFLLEDNNTGLSNDYS